MCGVLLPAPETIMQLFNTSYYTLKDKNCVQVQGDKREIRIFPTTLKRGSGSQVMHANMCGHAFYNTREP